MASKKLNIYFDQIVSELAKLEYDGPISISDLDPEMFDDAFQSGMSAEDVAADFNEVNKW